MELKCGVLLIDFFRKRVAHGVRNGRLRIRGFLVNGSRLDLFTLPSKKLRSFSSSFHYCTTRKTLQCHFLRMGFSV